MSGTLDKSTSIDLIELQHRIYAENKPVLMVIESAGGAVPAKIINEFISCLEPRGIEYHHYSPSAKPTSFTSLISYMKNTPKKGRLAIYDRSWYSRVVDAYQKKDDLSIAYMSINRFEKYFIDNGVIIVKIYLNMDQKTVKKNLKSYPKSLGANCGFLGDDACCYDDYSSDRKRISNMIDDTDMPYARWDVIEVGEYKKTVKDLVLTFMNRLKKYLDSPYVPKKCEMKFIYDNPREDVDFTKCIEKGEYQKRLDKLQAELAKLQCKLVSKKRSMVLGFEGWDAAGKGGAIKRITQALNPRGYRAVPISAPTKEELAHTHLWRFANVMPEPGHIVIFDRTWYGRMLVEPIESIIDQTTYSRSAEEINLFELSTVEDGTIVIKFWIDITNEEQLARFERRKTDKLKQWKITEEDWRNRKKWGTYEKYVNDMMKTTNTPYAPWYAISGQDKRFARIQVLEIIVKTLKKELKD